MVGNAAKHPKKQVQKMWRADGAKFHSVQCPRLIGLLVSGVDKSNEEPPALDVPLNDTTKNTNIVHLPQ